MKIVVLTPYLPHRRVGHGGGCAVRDLVRWLARRHQVLLASLVRPGEDALLSEVAELGAEIAPLPFLDRRAGGVERAVLWRARAAAGWRSLGSGFPWYVEKYWSADLSRRLVRAVERFAPDAVQIEYLQLSLLARDLHRWRAERSVSAPRLVLNTHELGSVPRERSAARARDPFRRAAARIEATAWRRLQVAATGWADRTLCVTPGDHDLLAGMGGQRLTTVPLGMDLEHIAADWEPDRRAPTVLFVGSFAHRPNRLGVAWLLDSIWPAIQARRPDANLVLAGRGSRRFLAGHDADRRWREDGVRATGFVDDLSPLFRRCSVFVAPLPEGGGIKIKVLEALARGVPVVTTGVGAEGILDARVAPDAPDAALIRDDAGTFAAAVVEMLADDDQARRLAAAGRRLMEGCFSWEAITARLTEIYAGE